MEPVGIPRNPEHPGVVGEQREGGESSTEQEMKQLTMEDALSGGNP